MNRILGQPRAIDVLQASLRSGRIHHAWIFSGPPGVGKFTTAVEFARILLAPDAGPNLSGMIEADPEGKTSRLIDAATHPDLHVVRKELALYSENAELRRKKQTNIPIDLLRETMLGGKSGEKQLEAPAYRTPALGHGKVFIIDEAELIDTTGQNALLKTLEEPPKQTYLVLVTSRPDRLLPTILSRCQHVRFGTLDEEAMQQWWSQAGMKLTDAERDWITRFSDGSPGQAVIASEYEMYQWQLTIAPMLREVEQGRYAAELGETLASFVEDYAKRFVKQFNKEEGKDAASKDIANKAGVRHVLNLLAQHARQQLAQAGNDSARIERALSMIDRIRDAETQIHSNVNLKMVLENLSSQLTDGARTAVA
ncbi:MAG: AAA family ATPase [Phycisphaerales bacterium]|nr:MAG: AAA family ATPase [Phycisphaerales bacterium]